MNGFYDRILPSFMNKYAKKWGARVEPAAIHTDLDRFNYEGPDPQDARTRADDQAGEAIDRSVGLGRQWVAVERAAREGVPFADAMRENGSAELADIVGGKMVERPNTAPVHAVDITPQMRESVMRGQPLWEGEATGTPGTYRDTMPDYAAYRQNTAFPEDAAGAHMAAREYTRQRGTETGHEHIAVYDPEQNAITILARAGYVDRVHFNAPGLDERLADPNAGLVIHHNHPVNTALSGTDIAALAHPGVEAIVAHAHGPDVFSARLTPEARAAVLNARPDRPPDAELSQVYQAANKIVRPALTMQALAGKIGGKEFDALQADLVNRALDAAGVIDYVSSRAPESLAENVRRSIIARAAGEAADLPGLIQATTGYRWRNPCSP